MLDNATLSSRWNNTTSASQMPSPAPRTHHTAAFVDKALFVSGGTGSSGALFDLWRWNNMSSTDYQSVGEWLLLAEGHHVPLSSSGPFKPHGATVLVSPWGMLSVGGLVQDRVIKKGMNAWVIDPVSKLWRPVTVSMRPTARYHESSNVKHQHTSEYPLVA